MLGLLIDELSNLMSFCRILANFPILLCVNVLTSLSLAGYMEAGIGPSKAVIEKEKWKKKTKSPQGKEDKEQMK